MEATRSCCQRCVFHGYVYVSPTPPALLRQLKGRPSSACWPCLIIRTPQSIVDEMRREMGLFKQLQSFMFTDTDGREQVGAGQVAARAQQAPGTAPRPGQTPCHAPSLHTAQTHCAGSPSTRASRPCCLTKWCGAGQHSTVSTSMRGSAAGGLIASLPTGACAGHQRAAAGGRGGGPPQQPRPDHAGAAKGARAPPARPACMGARPQEAECNSGGTNCQRADNLMHQALLEEPERAWDLDRLTA